MVVQMCYIRCGHPSYYYTTSFSPQTSIHNLEGKGKANYDVMRRKHTGEIILCRDYFTVFLRKELLQNDVHYSLHSSFKLQHLPLEK